MELIYKTNRAYRIVNRHCSIIIGFTYISATATIMSKFRIGISQCIPKEISRSVPTEADIENAWVIGK